MKQSRNARRTAGSYLAAIGLLFGAACVPTAYAFADAGSYLAARQAILNNDLEAQATYGASAVKSDPSNVSILETAISARISTGQFEDADGFAIMLKNADPSSQIAAMVLIPKMVKNAEWDALLAALDENRGISDLIDRLTRAWAYVGKGEMNKALDLFDEAVGKGEGFEFLVPYNRALALALVGDFEGGVEILSQPEQLLTGSAVIARVQMLSQLERSDEALALMTDAFGETSDAQVMAINAQLARGETLPFDMVTSAQDGIAGVFNAVTQALDGGLEDSYTLLYARIAQYLRPDFATYTLQVANLLERMGNYDLATEAYDTISPDDPVYLRSELGRADALRAAGKKDAETEVLRQLTKLYGDSPQAHMALGDAMRRDENYQGAADAYSMALSLTPTLTAAQWPLLFTRGIAYERLGQWDKAEADFRKALELEPGQPRVLNYMGYSFLEMRENLDEAMDMIRAAVAAQPNDGFITDSLAWGLFRLGRFDEAVAPMELAVELEPVDPILNDHLGDIYWAVGREREAKFQWERALSFEPEDEEAIRIRKKLMLGLDRVLIDEGEEPTHALSDG